MATTPFDVTQLQHDAGWESLLARFPADLDQSAFDCLALFRHRGFVTATLLLRLILAYACGLSMPLVTAWAAAHGLVTITPEALHGRIKRAHHWLSALVLHVLAHRAGINSQVLTALGLRLRLIDGTAPPRPGATGTDWRIHLSLDLRTQILEDVHLTSDTVGETFAHFTCRPGDVFVGERNFATRKGLWHTVQAGAAALVRFTWRNLPLRRRDGTPFPLWEHARSLALNTYGEWDVETKPTKDIPAMPGRLIIFRLPVEAAAHTQAHNLKRRKKDTKTPPDAETLASWQYIMLFTTLSAAVLPAGLVLARYRFRWQIELAIKRYKSLCGLAKLKTRLTTSCQTVLWAKLLLILLCERLGPTAEDFPPGTGGCSPSDQPLALDGAPVAHTPRVDYPCALAAHPAGLAARLGTLSN